MFQIETRSISLMQGPGMTIITYYWMKYHISCRMLKNAFSLYTRPCDLTNQHTSFPGSNHRMLVQ